MFGEGLCPPEPSRSNNTEVVVRVTTNRGCEARPGQLPCQGAAQAGDVGHDRRVEQHLQRTATDNTAHFSSPQSADTQVG